MAGGWDEAVVRKSAVKVGFHEERTFGELPISRSPTSA